MPQAFVGFFLYCRLQRLSLPVKLHHTIALRLSLGVQDYQCLFLVADITQPEPPAVRGVHLAAPEYPVQVEGKELHRLLALLLRHWRKSTVYVF